MVKKITFLMEDDLDTRFRNSVFQKKGMHKGNLTDALIEAIENWIKTPVQVLQPQVTPEVSVGSKA
jgi:hypothetical protein